MYRNISYTAAYAEMTRCILQGAEALQQRDPTTAIQNFSRAARLADEANLGAQPFIGSNRNLASAYRLAGHLADAERICRDLLERPEVGDEDRPYILHELGMILAQSGSPEAAHLLATALNQYTEREDALLCALDLAELWLTNGEANRAYDLLNDLVHPDDQTEYRERFCHAQLVLAHSALAMGQIDLGKSHLESSCSALTEVEAPVLRALSLAILAEKELLEGQAEAAQAHSIAALEHGLAEVEQDTGEVLRTIASVFLKICRTCPT